MTPSLRAAHCVLIGLLTTGCGTMGIRYLGIRPDPPGTTRDRDVMDRCATEIKKLGLNDGKHCVGCWQFYQTQKWADQLVESYRTRATLNEWSIYAAGTIALGALATVGGLAVAGAAASETSGLVSVSSGFASGFFAFLDNKARAGYYTQAANDIIKAQDQAWKTAFATPGQPNYLEAALALQSTITDRIAWLETQRKDQAAKTDVTAQLAALQKTTDQLTAALSASTTALSPPTGEAGDELTLTTAGIDLNSVRDSLKVFVGDKEAQNVKIVAPTSVKFTVPAQDQGKANAQSVLLKFGTMTVGQGQPFLYK